MVPTTRTLRTKEVQSAYMSAVEKGILKNGCVLCTKVSIKEFAHWIIVQNDFPYDLIAETHHMIIPRRHVTIEGITGEEWGEYHGICRPYIISNYQYIMESTHANQSIPEHFHLHLLKIKEGLDN